jgi:UDP-2-acetamido-3-amino-2,3-dideoxy-glucuronate N-acetyltransferase
MSVFVHPSSVVDAPCELGEGVKIWHFCHVSAGASLGEGVMLGQNVFVAPGVRLGARTRVQNNVSLYEGLTCEEEVFLGPSVVFTNVLTPRVQHSRRGQFAKTLVRRGASLGANATILCGLTIGRYALIGAGSVVTRDVPDFGRVVGNPGRLVGFSCACGERLALALRGALGESAACAACGASYLREAAGVRELSPPAPSGQRP